MTKQETDETMRKVLNWLTEEGIYRDKVSDDKANYHFKTEFPSESKRFIGIIQPKDRDDLILIISSVTLTKEHHDGLNLKPKKEKEDTGRLFLFCSYTFVCGRRASSFFVLFLGTG